MHVTLHDIDAEFLPHAVVQISASLTASSPIVTVNIFLHVAGACWFNLTFEITSLRNAVVLFPYARAAHKTPCDQLRSQQTASPQLFFSLSFIDRPGLRPVQRQCPDLFRVWNPSAIHRLMADQEVARGP